MFRFVASLVVKPFSPNQSSKNYEGEYYSFPVQKYFYLIGLLYFTSDKSDCYVSDREPAFHDQ